jgi:hypothetical protein
MEQYIPKSALVAEIENLVSTYKKCPTRNSYEDGLKIGRLIGYKDALHKIDTLKVKEVQEADLEKDFGLYWGIYTDNGGSLNDYEVAKHFFELGMAVSNKAQKGE